jgi:UDP-GlcNAc:undecaprenyl-phosphate GlcNAc-1-phosphate transferase
VIALVGMINAMNHSDGLDGLAGGEAVMTLGCLAFLAYLAGGATPVLVSAAVLGGVFGFLRHNNHPARVFMGDSGSQFLGFSVGVLAVALTQQVNPMLSMALPLLILGLPIADILAVFAKRIYRRMNWFRATRNHVHHRLLELGFRHHQAVMIIYAVQATLVGSALVFAYESDLLVASIYVGVCATVFAALAAAEHRGWRFEGRAARAASRLGAWVRHPRVRKAPLTFVQIVLPAYFVAAPFVLPGIPADLRIAAGAALLLSLVAVLVRPAGWAGAVLRFGVYTGAAAVVVLMARGGAYEIAPYAWLDATLFVLLAAAVMAAIRLDPDLDFRTTPLDLLLVMLVLCVAWLGQEQLSEFHLGSVVLRIATLFYACELVLAHRGARPLRALRRAVGTGSAVLLARLLAVF